MTNLKETSQKCESYQVRLITDDMVSLVGNRLSFIANCLLQLPITNYQLPSGFASSLRRETRLQDWTHQLPITNHQLPITNYQLPIPAM